MKAHPKTGTSGELEFFVGQQNVIDFATDGMPAVLSTPILIGWLERTARHTLAPCLDPDERSVGIEVDVRHLAATPLGARVKCIARVISVDGRQVQFQVEAHDGHELIIKGLHRRAVVRVGSFAKKLMKKQ